MCGHEFSVAVIFSPIRFKVLPLCVGSSSRKSMWRVLNSKFLSISQKTMDRLKKCLSIYLNFLEKVTVCPALIYKISPDYQLCSFFLEWNILIGSCCSQKSLTPSLEHVFPLFSAIKFKGSRDQGCLPHVLYMYTQNYLFFKSSLRPTRFILHAD